MALSDEKFLAARCGAPSFSSGPGVSRAETAA
jgi:hypothetical protein